MNNINIINKYKKMGWIFYNVCNSKNQMHNLIVVEISSSNKEGELAVNSFIEYVNSRGSGIKFSIVKNEDINNLIVMKYYSYGIGRTVYNGYDFNQQYFEPIYRKMIMMND